MTLTLSNTSWFTAKPAAPLFKSVRAKSTGAVDTLTPTPTEPSYETAERDTWYDTKGPFEIFLDMFWARRNVVGSRRTRRSYRTALRWQAAATIPLFPPLGLFLILLNTCFGLRPKATRVAFIASVTFAALVIANATLTADPLTLASLR